MIHEPMTAEQMTHAKLQATNLLKIVDRWVAARGIDARTEIGQAYTAAADAAGTDIARALLQRDAELKAALERVRVATEALRKNVATLQEQRRRCQYWGKSHHELDAAIEDGIDVLPKIIHEVPMLGRCPTCNRGLGDYHGWQCTRAALNPPSAT